MKSNARSPLDDFIAPIERDIRVASFVAVAANALWLIQAGVLAVVLSQMVAGHIETVVPYIAVFIGLAVLKSCLGMVAEKMAADAGDSLVAQCRRVMVETETRHQFGTMGAGATAALGFEKLDLLRPYLGRYKQSMARVKVIPFLILLIAGYFSWVTALIFVITGPVIPVFMALIGWAAKDASEKQLSQMGTINDMIVDRVPAIVDMRLLNATTAFVDGFSAAANQLRERTMAVLKIAFLTSTVLELFAAIGVALMAIYLGFSVLGQINFGASGGGLTPFAVIWILLIAPEFYQSLRDLSAAWHDKAAAEAVVDEWSNWQAQQRAPIMGVEPALGLGGFSLEMRDVHVRRDRQVGLPDFRLDEGQSIAVTGPSGAGKTTLLRAAAGLHPIDAGSIIVCGAALAEDTAFAWREQIGWMPQSPHFFDDTIRFNLGLGHDVDIDAALSAVAMSSVVQALPKGLDTVLGETGGGLSGGEARRLTLARAIAANPAVLIADEPTADLDPNTAEIVIDALCDLQRKGTALLIATHDENLIARLDRKIEVSL